MHQRNFKMPQMKEERKNSQFPKAQLTLHQQTSRRNRSYYLLIRERDCDRTDSLYGLKLMVRKWTFQGTNQRLGSLMYFTDCHLSRKLRKGSDACLEELCKMGWQHCFHFCDRQCLSNFSLLKGGQAFVQREVLLSARFERCL